MSLFDLLHAAVRPQIAAQTDGEALASIVEGTETLPPRDSAHLRGEDPSIRR